MKIKTAVLFSGGKDSCLALAYALQDTEVMCLISIESKNKESYMFHTPNINWAVKQAEVIDRPLIVQETDGEKETELKDLENAIEEAKKKFGIKGIVTGAIASTYQASRIEEICSKLGLECFNPLWQKNQLDELKEIVKRKIEAIVIGVFAEGLEDFIGRKIDEVFIEDIQKVEQKLKINVAGEGGEFESFVLNAPFFKKKLIVEKSRIGEDKEKGKVLIIEEMRLEKK